MGWFSSATSWISSKVSSAASYVKEKVSEGLSWAREKASQAVDWIAEKGEKFIDDVKSVYKKVKPFLQKARPWIDNIAKTVGVKFPWIGAALFGLGKVVDGLLALENSPVAQAVEKALRGAIKFAQFVKERYLTPEEMQEAEEYKETFSQAQQANNLSAEELKSLQLAEMLVNYGRVKTELRDVLEMGVGDFQHYLRLRATQKLLDEADHKLTTTQDINDISADDVFLVNAAEALISTADLSEESALRLDQIVQERFGKSLIPFVFEELMMVWVQKHQSLEQDWKNFSKEFSKERVLKTRLEVAKKTSSLTEEEQEIYKELLPRLTGMETKLTRLDKERRSMKNYLYAAEGFMQILEKNDQMLQDEDKDYLLDDSAEIAAIIMRVAQNNVDWDSLTEDEQSLITDYANIFEEEGKLRAQALQAEVEVVA